MAERITYFKADEGVSRNNFNSRLEQINSEFDKADAAKGAAKGVATLDDNGKLVQMPSASDVRALPNTGGTVTGNVKLSNGTSSVSVEVERKINDVDYKSLDGIANVSSTPAAVTDFYEGGTWKSRLALLASGLKLKINSGSTYYDVYHTGNKPTAADVGAPNLESNGSINGAQACSSVREVTANIILAAGDVGKMLVCYGGADITITLPAGLPARSEFEIVRWGAGTVTITAASGVTLYSAETARTIKNRYGVVSIKRIWSDYESWLLVGDLG